MNRIIQPAGLGGFRSISKFDPAISSIHQNRPLTDIMINELQEAEGFVSNKAFPVVPVDQKSDEFYIFDKASMLRSQMKTVNHLDYAPVVGYDIDTSTFNCIIKAGAMPRSKGMSWNSDFDLESQDSSFLGQQAMLAREIDFSSLVAASVWDTQREGKASGVSTNEFLQFNDSSSTPKKVIDKYINEARIAAGGHRPNLCICGSAVWEQLQNHDDFLQLIKYGGGNADPAQVTPDAMAGLFRLSQGFHIAEGVYNSAEEGLTAAYTDIIPDDAMLFLYVAENPGIKTKSAGYCFAWSAYDPALARGGDPRDSAMVRTFEDQKIVGGGGKIIEAVTSYVFKVTSSDCGLYMYTCVA